VIRSAKQRTEATAGAGRRRAVRRTRRGVLPFVALVVAGLGACRSASRGGTDDRALGEAIDASLDRAVEQYTALDRTVADTLCPRTVHPDGTLWTSSSRWWTSGFFPGSLWYLYQYTNDPKLRERALTRTWALEREKLNASDHDIGFKIFTSFGNAWRLTGDSTLVPVLLTAARTLASRFDPRVGAIRSWGARSDTTGPFTVIIDNMMNLQLLFWAARQSGDGTLFDIAVSHADKTLENHFRPDGSSYHVVEYDPHTGNVLRKRTQQGYADSSAWARGQAWGLYGYTVAYRETGYARYLRQAVKIAHFILAGPHLPADGVPYWDFDAPGIPDTYRDASAAAITASALLELGDFVEDSLRARYRREAETILRTLSQPPYRTRGDERADFLLDHGVGNLPGKSEVDVPLSYADYYYLEGLMRLRAILRDSTRAAHVTTLGDGWSRSSVNAVIFRQHGLVTHDSIQYAAFYDPEGRMVLARRPFGAGHWELHRTRYSGNVRDAHDAISLGVDGRGVLHVSWGQHGDSLHYARSVRPGALELTDPQSMTGEDEEEVTYPQFYELPGGDLLFVYRDGSSGDGDVDLDRYDLSSGRWTALAHPLIDGEGRRNAYVNQLAVDEDGGWHLSWTWRETWDVATNHDILYAHSRDQGVTWQRSSGEAYTLPITAASAEVAWTLPQRRGLINQTTMAVGGSGRPYIATYWRPEGSDIPQYELVWRDDDAWHALPIGHRTTAFRLEGGGTRRIPMSRPLVLIGPGGVIDVVFRDFERSGGISLARSTDPAHSDWQIRQIYTPSVGLWEPVWDATAWRRHHRLDLLVERVGQGQGETLEELPAQPVRVLDWSAEALRESGGLR